MRFGSESKKKWGKCVLFRIGMNLAAARKKTGGKIKEECRRALQGSGRKGEN